MIRLNYEKQEAFDRLDDLIVWLKTPRRGGRQPLGTAGGPEGLEGGQRGQGHKDTIPAALWFGR